MPTWLERVLRLLNSGSNPQRVFTREELKSFHQANRHALTLPSSVTASRLIDALTDSGTLQKISISPEKGAKAQDGSPYKPVTRFLRGDANAIDVALSFRKGSYLSHASAAEVHGILPPTNTIYVNKEQSAKFPSAAPLTQEAVNLAFSYSPRSSNLVYRHENKRIVRVSGKHTQNLEVITQQLPSPIAYTALERTLIDIAVRPNYAGGTNAVLLAFRNALQRISLPKLVDVLRGMNYIYPYHQVLGFYLRKVGYTVEDTAELRSLGIKLDFFLTHGMKKPEFDAEWRLFFPKDLSWT